jgi:hypothetical protein
MIDIRDDGRGVIGIRIHVFHGLAASSQDCAQEVPLGRDRLVGCHADDVAERRQHVGGSNDRAQLADVLRPYRIGQRRNVYGTEVERDDLFAEAPDPDQFGILRRHARGL